MRKFLSLILFFFFTSLVFGQLEKIRNLDPHFDEISGLEFYNDSVLIALLDGGNVAELYFFDLQGNEIHSLSVSNASNTDWEDLCMDKEGNIYIGDIGNNLNQRTDLKIYKIKGKGLLEKSSVNAEVIFFAYPEQKAFPPANDAMYFDAESLMCDEENLYIVTKCRTSPFDGTAYVYELPQTPGTWLAKKITEIKPGNQNWYDHSFTGGTLIGNQAYLLSYNRLYLYEFRNNQFNLVKFERLGRTTQKESIAVRKDKIFIADEKFPLFGGRNLYSFKWQKN